MKTETHPDVELDVCPDCGGTYFDRGELDILITARTHTVESVPDIHNTTELVCPACSAKMEEANLVLVDQVPVERCPGCRGLFLDRAELQTINAILREDGRTKHEEQLRKYIDGRLVTVRSRTEATPSPGRNSNTPQLGFAERIIVTVYYRAELNNDFSAVRATPFNKLLRAIGVRRGLALSQVTPHIERHYLVSGKDELQAARSMAHSVQEKIEQIDLGKLKVLTKRGEISLYDNGVVYMEGLYSEKELVLLVNKTRKMVAELVELARAVDRQTEKN